MSTDSYSISQGTVRCELRQTTLVVTIDNPPANALAVLVRRGLQRAMADAEADPHCQSVVLIGAGQNFIGGADIRELGIARQSPSVSDICNAIEQSAKPVISAISGACLGGGLEIALSTHYRVAAEDAKMGFPEVALGLLPGAGGTQRAPRLVGVVAALDLMLSGKHVGAEDARALGLVDQVVPAAQLLDVGLVVAAQIVAGELRGNRTGEISEGLAEDEENRKAVKRARLHLQQKSRHLLSPSRIVDCVEASFTRPIADGLALERKHFLECEASAQRSGLVHAFFAERAAAKVPEARSARSRTLQHVGVVGGGTMGAGITVALLDAGFHVIMIECDASALARGKGFVERVYDGLISKGRISTTVRQSVMARFSGSTDYGALADVDLVIEAVFEEMDVKKEVFAFLDRHCKRGCILASNTSYLDINELAGSISRPEDVIGLHFFSPANIMKLLEIVVPARVSPDVVATAFELARRMKKVPVRAGVCDGFIGNRILAQYKLAGDYLVEDGASPYQVDEAMREFGFAMGMFQVSDLAGGDIGWATRKRKALTRDPRQRYVQIADRICENGWFGQKTGRGWYQYPQGSRSGIHDPEVLAIVDQERLRAGIKARTWTNENIMRRIMAAMVNEGAKVLKEKIALRPSDIDAAFVHGYGFPRWRGGPMHYADSVGVDKVLSDIREFALEDAMFWRPCPLLEKLASQSARFASLNNDIKEQT